jgi:hypothetical protein
MATTQVRIPIGFPDTAEGRAKALSDGASECLYAAKILDSDDRAHTGEYILTFHALELALKAFLAKTGVSDDDLQYDYGHKLPDLYKEACSRGLTISFPNIEFTLDWIQQYHGRGSLLRYEFRKIRQLPLCNTLFPLVEGILSASK